MKDDRLLFIAMLAAAGFAVYYFFFRGSAQAASLGSEGGTGTAGLAPGGLSQDQAPFVPPAALAAMGGVAGGIPVDGKLGEEPPPPGISGGGVKKLLDDVKDVAAGKKDPSTVAIHNEPKVLIENLKDVAAGTKPFEEVPIHTLPIPVRSQTTEAKDILADIRASRPVPPPPPPAAGQSVSPIPPPKLDSPPPPAAGQTTSPKPIWGPQWGGRPPPTLAEQLAARKAAPPPPAAGQTSGTGSARVFSQFGTRPAATSRFGN